MNIKQVIGRWGEGYAAGMYQQNNYVIVGRNMFNKKGKQLGEIDFVAIRDQTIAFVEVKTRTQVVFGAPEDSISVIKRRRLTRAVQWFLVRYPRFAKLQPQIDICAILLNLPDSAEVVNLDKCVKYAKVIPNAVELTWTEWARSSLLFYPFQKPSSKNN